MPQTTPLPLAATGSSTSLAPLASALVALTKPRLASFSVLSGLVGYYVAAMPVRENQTTGFAAASLTVALCGLSLSAGGALSLNQWWERGPDAQMLRTRGRPLPSGRLFPAEALLWSVALGTAGVAVLAISSGWAAFWSLLTIVLYGLVYTPLKRCTRWATEVGALSGALPPVIGAAAAGQPGAPAAWALAAIVLFWQLPHFFAIGWKYREDYRRAGFALLPAVDPTGRRTARAAWYYTWLMVAASLVPCATGLLGPVFSVAAVVGGGLMLTSSYAFIQARPDRERAARRLFSHSLLYLPWIMAALIADCVWG